MVRVKSWKIRLFITLRFYLNANESNHKHKVNLTNLLLGQNDKVRSCILFPYDQYGKMLKLSFLFSLQFITVFLLAHTS